jgi:hypothetical protein
VMLARALTAKGTSQVRVPGVNQKGKRL